MVDSCRTCPTARQGSSSSATSGTTFTYNSPDKHSGGVTYGGYSEQHRRRRALRAARARRSSTPRPPRRCSARASPPTRRCATGRSAQGKTVGVVGLGGLGHMGGEVRARVGRARTSVHHVAEARSTDAPAPRRRRGRGLEERRRDEGRTQAARLHPRHACPRRTTSTPTSQLLERDGTMVLVGAPPTPHPSPTFSHAGRQRATLRRLAHRRHRGDAGDARLLRRARHHLRHRAASRSRQINEAYERMLKSDVKYRFVIDMASLKR